MQNKQEKKISFRTRTSGQIRKTTEAGKKLRKRYMMTIDENGHKVLAENGYTNQYGLIQENLESTLIANILDKATMGDPEALNKVQGHYMDATNLPKSLADAQNKILELRQQFDTLPLNVRRAFDYSPEKYVQQFGTKNWEDAMGITKLREDAEKEKIKKESIAKHDKDTETEVK